MAVGFRAKKSMASINTLALPSEIRYSIYKPCDKGDSVPFDTNNRRYGSSKNKPDTNGKHPWKAEVTEGDKDVPVAVSVLGIQKFMNRITQLWRVKRWIKKNSMH